MGDIFNFEGPLFWIASGIAVVLLGVLLFLIYRRDVKVVEKPAEDVKTPVEEPVVDVVEVVEVKETKKPAKPKEEKKEEVVKPAPEVKKAAAVEVYEVVEHPDGGWQVKKPSATRALKRFENKKEAADFAKEKNA